MKYPILVTVLAVALSSVAVAAEPGSETPAAQSALRRLQDGNHRYSEDAATHPRQGSTQREATANGQQPFAMVLSCADSRVPDEIVFDQGIGDLFVVRVAGNIADVNDTASLEFGAKHLGAPLLVVMGHSNCGAVKAAVDNAKFDNNLANLMVEIAPAVERTRREHPNLRGDDLLNAAIETNVWYSIETLFRRSAVLRDRARNGQLEVVGAVYDLVSGKVRWLGQHPDEARLIAPK